jgi:hypothetical protein
MPFAPANTRFGFTLLWTLATFGGFLFYIFWENWKEKEFGVAIAPCYQL